MIQHSSDAGVSSLAASPIGSSKHQITPLKIKRKTSRRDQGADVHAASTCSTPIRFHAGNSYNNFSSPSDSFPCSQDNRPDVVWDYTSPKPPAGTKKKEIRITVDEFLKNLNHNKSPECNTQNSHYIKLLERWMAKQNTPVCAKKPVRTAKRDNKMRTRRVFQEIKQFMESMKQNNEDKTKANDKECIVDANTVPNGEPLNQSGCSVNKNFLEGDSTENDSIEALWGEADNSFIVKATQHLEVSSLKHNAQNKNIEITSTIPETAYSTSNIPKHEIQENISKDSSNKQIFDSDLQAQVLLSQIMSCDWDSDSDFEDFENGFIMGDDALSLIPDEVLSGTFTDNENGTHHTDSEKPGQNSRKLTASVSNTASEAKVDSENKSCEISFGCTESNRVPSGAGNMSEVELFNNFEDESFGDESILCKPEVLSWIDEVESKLSQSQNCTLQLSQGPKCSPDEIEKKKDAAILRLKRNRLRKKK